MTLSPRLAAILEELPLKPGLRVLEIGCGPGALARAMAARVGDGFVLAIDRSAKAIAQAGTSSARELSTGRPAFKQVSIEDFALGEGEALFDLVVAVRVGALDGRHPAAGRQGMERIAAALTAKGRLFVDGQDVPVPR